MCVAPTVQPSSWDELTVAHELEQKRSSKVFFFFFFAQTHKTAASSNVLKNAENSQMYVGG